MRVGAWFLANVRLIKNRTHHIQNNERFTGKFFQFFAFLYEFSHFYTSLIQWIQQKLREEKKSKLRWQIILTFNSALSILTFLRMPSMDYMSFCWVYTSFCRDGKQKQHGNTWCGTNGIAKVENHVKIFSSREEVFFLSLPIVLVGMYVMCLVQSLVVVSRRFQFIQLNF